MELLMAQCMELIARRTYLSGTIQDKPKTYTANN